MSQVWPLMFINVNMCKWPVNYASQVPHVHQSYMCKWHANYASQVTHVHQSYMCKWPVNYASQVPHVHQCFMCKWYANFAEFEEHQSTLASIVPQWVGTNQVCSKKATKITSMLLARVETGSCG
jgi:hypothetical protein